MNTPSQTPKPSQPIGLQVSASAARPGTFFAGAPSVSAASPRARRSVFLRDAFRPFYLGGSLVAAFAIPLWLGMWYHPSFTPSLPALYWHTHEMVFGFAVAIIIGFLFTAARNWTGLALPDGVPLAILVLLWFAGRVGVFFFYSTPAAIIDSLLLPIVAGVLAFKFIRARSFASIPLVGVLSALAIANIAFHAAVLRWIGLAPLGAIEFGLMMVVLIEMIIGGRIVPAFTASAIPGVRQRRSARLNRAAIVLAAAAFVSDASRAPLWLIASLSIVAGTLAVVQAIGWNPLASRSKSILWILHAAYAFIPIGLFLLGMSWMNVLPRSAAIHALGVGSMGGLIIGMITRTALGHSGRPVRAGCAETICYTLVLLAAALRVSASLVPPASMTLMLGAGSAWSAAFLLYAITYAPILCRARAGA
jgi:uncharacterized protein involved in response to NO